MAEQENKKYEFPWGVELKPFYKPEDIHDIDYEKCINDPGVYPYTRGGFPLMYRSRPLLIRVYSGFLSGEDSNSRLKYLFDRGMKALSIALDLPTQLTPPSLAPMVYPLSPRIW